MRNQILKLTQLALQSNIAAGSSARSDVEMLPAIAVLALAGDGAAREQFLDLISQMAEEDWGVQAFGRESGLNDCFAIRGIVEAYKGLIEAELVPSEHRHRIAPWLHQFALIRANGAITKLPGFAPWHQRNQCVPASCVYEIADLLDHSVAPAAFDTQPLWQWADANMVGWDLNWRTPDDSWLYQAIWTWSAYRHAALRRPDLLHSENARRSFDFYKQLSVPGGHTLVFGDTRVGDHFGPMTSLLLGARLFEDHEQLWLARELLQEAEAWGAHEMLHWRFSEAYRAYQLCPREIKAVRPAGLTSMLLTSPLAGRGWSLEDTPYNDSVKNTNPHFPNRGRDTCNYDDIYQLRDPQLYATPRPDKLIFREGYELGTMLGLVDLRAQGLHDHPDALGVTTLICDEVPWLVETPYNPRGFNRQRWLHNVPVFRRGAHTAAGLKTWQSDTWREVAPGDASLEQRDRVVVATARLRHDAFDYLALDGDLFDVERIILFVPDQLFLVVDRLIAATDAEVTIGQAWHTTSTVAFRDNAATLTRGPHRFEARFAQSRPLAWDFSQHVSVEVDPFYFPVPVQDLLCHGVCRLKPSEIISFVAAFGRTVAPVTLEQAGPLTTVVCGKLTLTIPAPSPTLPVAVTWR